jgi:hypothetical protein
MKRLYEIFDVWYGVNLEVVNCEEDTQGIPFVARSTKNNGITTYVKIIDDITPNPKHTLSVACSGSVLSTFYHPYEYYSGRDVYILQPKGNLSVQEMLFYCSAIEHNMYRYNYGRQANKTLKKIIVPDSKNFIKDNYHNMKNPFPEIDVCTKIIIDSNNAKVKLSDIFEIKNSKSLELINCEEIENGICFISRTSANNGVVARVKELDDLEPMPANAITVALGGSVLSSFYQEEPFYTAFHIACLYPKTEMSKEEMLYYCAIIEYNKYRYNFGRQANKTLKNILIPLIKKV